VAAREKNGVYIAQENYLQLTSEMDAQGKEIVEKLERIKAMEDELARKEEAFQQLQMLYDEQKNVLQVRLRLNECSAESLDNRSINQKSQIKLG
jgi:kinesin family member 11